MALLFAVGVSLGMSKDKDGSAALSGLVAYLVVTTLLSTSTVAMLLGIDPSEANAAFAKIGNQFIGILSGLIAAAMYNRFSHVKLPDTLAFFSGKRLVPIVTSIVMMGVSGILFFVWPVIYSGLGGDANVLEIENCITRLRVEIKDMNLVNEAKIKEAKVPGIKVIGPTSIQVIVGPQVQFVADEIEKMRKSKNIG